MSVVAPSGSYRFLCHCCQITELRIANQSKNRAMSPPCSGASKAKKAKQIQRASSTKIIHIGGLLKRYNHPTWTIWITSARIPPVAASSTNSQLSEISARRAIAIPAIVPTNGLKNSSALCKKRRFTRSFEIVSSSNDQITKMAITNTWGIWAKIGTADHSCSPENKPISSNGRASLRPVAAEIESTASSSGMITSLCQ